MDFLDKNFIQHPYPTFRRLRDEEPIFWHESLGCWIVSRFDDCAYVLGSAGTFSSDYRKAGIETPAADVTVQSVEPPEHTGVRRSLRRGLQRSVDLADLERRLDRETEERLAGCRDEGTFDFVSQVALPVSVSAACALLGADHSGNPELYACAEGVARSMSGELIPENVSAGVAAREQLSRMIADGVLRSERSGLLAELGSFEGEPGGYDLLVNSVRVMFLAAINSNQRACGNAVNALLEEPDAADRLARAEGPDLDRAIHELVRFDSPVQAHEKVCLGTDELCGQTVRHGERVTVLIGSANRDERRFTAPDALDFDRSENVHLAFGWGHHTCLGLVMARVQLRAVLKNCFGPGAPRLARGGAAVRENNPALRGFSALPVRCR
ncbi:cytochrome P450 [Streptomyces sp. NPDC054854]